MDTGQLRGLCGPTHGRMAATAAMIGGDWSVYAFHKSSGEEFAVVATICREQFIDERSPE